MNENQLTITAPTIPKEVADAIECLRWELGHTDADIVSEYLAEGKTATVSMCVLRRSIPFDTLLSVLVNGYVIEKSAEELAHDKIRVEYHFRMSYAHRNAIDAARADAIIFTLQTLGHKIEGVNA